MAQGRVLGLFRTAGRSRASAYSTSAAAPAVSCGTSTRKAGRRRSPAATSTRRVSNGSPAISLARRLRGRRTTADPRPDSSFDLIWAISVFTHLTDHWAAGCSTSIASSAGRRPHRDLLGALRCRGDRRRVVGGGPDRDQRPAATGRSWDRGGPLALIRRGGSGATGAAPSTSSSFDPTGFGSPDDRSLGSRRRRAATQARAVQSVDDLTRNRGRSPGDRRPSRHNIEQLLRESLAFRRASAAIATAGSEVAAAERRIASLYESTVSWRVTRPLRAARRLGRR